MQNLLKILAFLFLATVFFACTTETESKPGTDSEPVTDSSPQPVQEAPEVNYAADWQAFKKAVKDQNEEELEALVSEEAGPVVLEMLFAPEVVAAMESKDYEDLGEEEWEGKLCKTFVWEETFVTEEGDEFGSALFLYFQEKAEGLRLVGLLAAG